MRTLLQVSREARPIPREEGPHSLFDEPATGSNLALMMFVSTLNLIGLKVIFVVA